MQPKGVSASCHLPAKGFSKAVKIILQVQPNFLMTMSFFNAVKSSKVRLNENESEILKKTSVESKDFPFLKRAFKSLCSESQKKPFSLKRERKTDKQ